MRLHLLHVSSVTVHVSQLNIREFVRDCVRYCCGVIH